MFVNNAPIPVRIVYMLFGLLILMIIYQPITTLNFALPDDEWMVLRDPLVSSLKFDFIYFEKLFTTYNSLQFSPVNTLWYALIYKINGFDAYWYHVGSFGLHCVNIYFIYKLICRLLSDLDHNIASLVAAQASIIWAVHPLNVETVVWISSSKMLLMTSFGIYSLLMILEFFRNRKFTHYMLAIVSFIAANLCKEQAVLFPVFIYAIIFICPGKQLQINRSRMAIETVPFLILSVVFGLLAAHAQHTAIGQDAPLSNYPLMERLFFSFYCLIFYLAKTFLPMNLHYHYDYPMKPGEPLPLILYLFPAITAAIAWGIFYIVKKSKNRLIYLLFTLFTIIHLALCLQIVPLNRPAMLADRYMYLPGVGIWVVLVMYFHERRNVIMKFRFLKTAAVLLGVVYLFFLIYTSHQLVTNWQTLNRNHL
jgi:hypothetical protein